MNVLIFVVNYLADEHLIRFVNSVVLSLKGNDKVSVDMHVLDNSKKTHDELSILRERLDATGLSVDLHDHNTNSGYFGGLALAQSLVNDNVDCLLYCNPDIILESNFFTVLNNTQQDSNVGVIAPAILSKQDGFDQNPKYCERLRESKLQRLKKIYSNIFFFNGFNMLARIKEVISRFKKIENKSKVPHSADIYAPHGSIFIFSDPVFFKKLPAFPCFLFGEELFVAEEALIANKRIVYEPELQVLDVRHASINLLSNEFLRSLMYKSVTYILDTYYTVDTSKN